MLIYVYIEFSNYEVGRQTYRRTADPIRTDPYSWPEPIYIYQFFTFNVLHCCLFCHVLSDVVDVNSHTQAVAKGGLGAKRSLFCWLFEL